MLDRVLRLRHIDPGDDLSLRACQSQAQDLRDRIASGPIDGLTESVEALARHDHPFAYLVAMSGATRGISDDLWDGYFQAVSLAFGPPLAAAAARGRIVLPTDPPPEAEVENPLTVPVPGGPSWISDELLTSLVAESAPFLIRHPPEPAPVRRLGRVLRRRSAALPRVEAV